MSFRNRAEAAHLLAERLRVYKGKNPLVLAIPRGAVSMGRILADALGGELDVVLVRKLGAPMNPEFAVGSVDESGWAYIADHAASAGADVAYIEEEKQRQLEVMRQRRARYTAARASIDPAGRIVIVVDDGLATGATMISALRALRAKNPAQLIAAVPVSPPDTLRKVEKLADETVCLEVPEYFMAVGQFYKDFPQVEDGEVVTTLSMASAKHSQGGSAGSR
jgi:predicted phosphoribosyltransferase